MEYERRAAVVASFRAGKKPAEVMAWFGFKRTMVMDMWRKWKSCDNKDEFTAERQAHKRRSSAVRTDEFVNAVKDTVDNDGGQSYAKIAADMGCHKSTVCRTVKQDIGYSSYRKSHRMLLTEASKESRRVKAAALLSELKHDSAGMLRFFSDEKNFSQDQVSNRQNDRWICEAIEEVPVVKHTKFPSSVMVLGVISSEGDVMPPFFFPKGLRVTAEIYQEVLRDVVKPWMDRIANGRPYVFQQDSAPAHKARTTQAWLLNNVPHHWSPDLWPPSSPDCNPLDYFFWGVIEAKTNKHAHNTVDSLKAAIVAEFAAVDKDTVAKACESFRPRLEMVVAADGGYIE